MSEQALQVTQSPSASYADSPSILLSQIDVGVRARTNHEGIEGLAGSIEESGLIQPIVIVQKTETLVSAYESEYQISLDAEKPYLLTAGGRRFVALEFLGVERLYLGATCEPGYPGYIIRNEQDLLNQLILEARENLDREDMDWRDKLRLIVKAWRLAKREAALRGEVLVGNAFAATLGLQYGRVRPKQAEDIYNHFIANPLLYKDCTSILPQAYSVYLRSLAQDLSKINVVRSMETAPEVNSLDKMKLDGHKIVIQSEPAPKPKTESENPTPDALEEIITNQVVNLSRAFFNADGVSLLEDQNVGFCDHIICDPDYATSKDTLNSSPNSAARVDDYVPYVTPEESLSSLFRFVRAAGRVIPDHGFLVMWYSLDHHEKLHSACRAAGFTTQAWPLIWNKIDFRARSNAQPDRNFPKSTEYALVARKPGALLRKVQTSCVYTTTEGGSVTKILNHPFAKPYDLWTWIYSAVSRPGQVVFDPFVGAGSSSIAALNYGLVPTGSEIVPETYNDLIINLKTKYNSLLGSNVTFA